MKYRAVRPDCANIMNPQIPDANLQVIPPFDDSYLFTPTKKACLRTKVRFFNYIKYPSGQAAIVNLV